MTSPAKTREILIVGPSHSEDSLRARISGHLNRAFQDLSETPFLWDFKGVEHPRDLKTYITAHEVPLLVILDPSGSDYAASSSAWDQVCSGLRALDPAVCILTLTDSSSPSAETAIGWLDRGASGLLNLQAPDTSTEDALRDMLSGPLRVKVPRQLRVETKHRIELQMASFEQALVTETLNLGLGGLFVRTVPQNVAVGDEVEFVLEFTRLVSGGGGSSENIDPLVRLMNDETPSGAGSEMPGLARIEGSGTVVWIRHTAHEGAAEGIGIQFKDIDPAGFKKIQEFIASHRIKAFIPKS